MRKYAYWIFLFFIVAGLVASPSPKTARTRLADGFDQPVGKPDAEGYYMSRGFRAKYHMGEDWNGVAGGNSDLGDPVYSVAHGIVVLARDMRMAWGNLVIVRHTFIEDNQRKVLDSVYAHLDKITVKEGQQIVRGQQVGTIGNNRGMYRAHLHFELRKNIYIGYNQRGFAGDLTNYYIPGAFINQRRKLAGAGRSGEVAVDTFNLPSKSISSSADSKNESLASSKPSPESKPSKSFRVNRFEDSF
jgi:murein DD-endopeptidase MepM/ murein hydrolase activator NlpD